MLGCYLDESGTDENSSTAVLGGLLLEPDRFYYLDSEWFKALSKHHIESPLHMREFVPHGRFGHTGHADRRRLFSDLVALINEHKNRSVSATLTAAHYRKHFSPLFGDKDVSIYGMCFLLLATLQAKYCNDKYKYEIPFILDDGNRYRHHVLEMHKFIVESFQPTHFMNVGSLTFRTDEKLGVLQAADVIAWSARRRIAGKFNNGFEPLVELFDDRHIEQPFEEDWMAEVATGIRNRRLNR